MEQETLAKFESILDKYEMPKQANWNSLKEWADNAQYELVLLDADLLAGNKEEGLKWIDKEELIALIKLLNSSNSVEVSSSTGISVSLNDANLHKYLLLSLHKLLLLNLAWDTNLIANMPEDGKRLILDIEGNEDRFFHVELKKPLEGQDKYFIEPFSPEELDNILELAKRHKSFINKTIGVGRGKGNLFPILGVKVVDLLSYIPLEAFQGKKKTDILNFACDIMELTGILDYTPKLMELTRELAMAEKNGWVTGSIRESRQKQISRWIKKAKEVFCKGDSTPYCNNAFCDIYPVCKGDMTQFLKLL